MLFNLPYEVQLYILSLCSFEDLKTISRIPEFRKVMDDSVCIVDFTHAADLPPTFHVEDYSNTLRKTSTELYDFYIYYKNCSKFTSLDEITQMISLIPSRGMIVLDNLNYGVTYEQDFVQTLKQWQRNIVEKSELHFYFRRIKEKQGFPAKPVSFFEIFSLDRDYRNIKYHFDGVRNLHFSEHNVMIEDDPSVKLVSDSVTSIEFQLRRPFYVESYIPNLRSLTVLGSQIKGQFDKVETYTTDYPEIPHLPSLQSLTLTGSEIESFVVPEVVRELTLLCTIKHLVAPYITKLTVDGNKFPESSYDELKDLSILYRSGVNDEPVQYLDAPKLETLLINSVYIEATNAKPKKLIAREYFQPSGYDLYLKPFPMLDSLELNSIGSTLEELKKVNIAQLKTLKLKDLEWAQINSSFNFDVLEELEIQNVELQDYKRLLGPKLKSLTIYGVKNSMLAADLKGLPLEYMASDNMQYIDYNVKNLKIEFHDLLSLFGRFEKLTELTLTCNGDDIEEATPSQLNFSKLERLTFEDKFLPFPLEAKIIDASQCTSMPFDDDGYIIYVGNNVNTVILPKWFHKILRVVKSPHTNILYI